MQLASKISNVCGPHPLIHQRHGRTDRHDDMQPQYRSTKEHRAVKINVASVSGSVSNYETII